MDENAKTSRQAFSDWGLCYTYCCGDSFMFWFFTCSGGRGCHWLWKTPEMAWISLYGNLMHKRSKNKALHHDTFKGAPAYTHLLPVKPLAHWHCPVSGSHLPLLWQTHSSAQFGPNLPSGHRSVQTAPCRGTRETKKTLKRQKEKCQRIVNASLQKTTNETPPVTWKIIA